MIFKYHLTIILSLCFLIIYYNLPILYGESPIFVRQEVDDRPGDVVNSTNKPLTWEQVDICDIPNKPSVDIRGISYVSENEYLNATVWLDSPFNSFRTFDSDSSDFSSIDEDSNLINKIVNPFNAFSTFDSSDFSSIDEDSNLIYQIYSINSSSNKSDLIKPIIDGLRTKPTINSIELIPMKSEKGENFKIMFNYQNIKYIWIFTNKNNTKYLHSFEIHNYDKFYKKYLPIINKIINSTDFIQYSNTTFANYENPYFGVKLQYPIESFKNFNIQTFFRLTPNERESLHQWEPIFSINEINDDKPDMTSVQILTKNKTEDFNLEDFKKEMIEIYLRDTNNDIINYTNDFEIEKLLNIKKNYFSFKIEREESTLYYIFSLVTKGNKMYSFNYISNFELYLQNLPLYNKIINSTDFIQYSNTTFANYENPYFGVKLQYPINWNIIHSNFLRNQTIPLYSFLNTISPNTISPIFENHLIHPIATFESSEKPRIVKNYLDGRINDASNFDGIVDYYMLIDVSSIYDKGTDYAMQVQWNKTSSNWDRVFAELSRTGGRLLDIEYNISDFYANSQFSKEIGLQNFITFSLNLDKINNPDKFKIMIGTDAYYSSCFMTDVSQLLPIPPPNYTINPIITSPLILFPNDEKNMEIQIKTDSTTGSTVFFKSKPIEDNGINVTFSPANFSLNPNENSLSKVQITTSNTIVGTHNIPLFANITFPPTMQFSLGGITQNISNPVMTTIPLKSNITITVEPVPPFYQPLVDYIKNVIEPSANFILATIIPVATALFGLRVYFKKKHSSPRKKYKRNNIKKTSTDKS